MTSINDRMKQAREKAGLTQSELARSCGVSVQAVSQWESGSTKNPAASNVLATAKATGLSIEWLITGRQPVTARSIDDEHSSGVSEPMAEYCISKPPSRSRSSEEATLISMIELGVDKGFLTTQHLKAIRELVQLMTRHEEWHG
ncbi:helix-turn-helix transcriptional regulator [uncultured Microbulbifer sp.]|uniref:helix-turn-helix domain-containing protein n=1 Tax=uncultured Microbulbifer sp. TaxID=348147 RepID=UPI0025E8D421|nr:helix-turn-helix transcriptional regulator [uncultured Microbulbifer sp.]